MERKLAHLYEHHGTCTATYVRRRVHDNLAIIVSRVEAAIGKDVSNEASELAGSEV